jgi:RES domain-containing protein
MIFYRFAHVRFSHDISGEGSRLKGGRWNLRGIPALYTSEHISLGLLEMLVNANTLEELQQIRLMEIEVAESSSIEVLNLKKLRKNWVTDFEYTQWIGSEILKENNALVFKCPSAVVNNENNFVLNPLHKDYKKVKLINSSSFYFDPRLFKNPI